MFNILNLKNNNDISSLWQSLEKLLLHIIFQRKEMIKYV